MSDRKLISVGLCGALLALICCFTPVLPMVLGLLGLSGLIGFVYTDAVLLPIAAAFGLLAVIGARRKRRRG